MSDPATADAGFPPVLLHAGSYTLPDLLKASAHVEELTTDTGREKNLALLADRAITDREELAQRMGTPVPEGHTIQLIEDAQGREIEAPVPIVAEESAESTTDETPARRGKRA